MISLLTMLAINELKSYGQNELKIRVHVKLLVWNDDLNEKYFWCNCQNKFLMLEMNDDAWIND